MTSMRLPGGRLSALFGAIAIAAVLPSRVAQASGYLTARFGGDHGTPAAGNAYAVYFNPAALGGTKGTHVTLDAALAFRHVSYERTPDALSASSSSQRNDPVYRAVNTGKAELFNVIPVPFIGATSDLGTKNLRVGYAFYVPFGGIAQWNDRGAYRDHPTAPGAVDGPQRWHNINGMLLSFYNTVAVAYRFEKARLTFGANFSVVHHQVKTVRARNLDGSDDIATMNGSLKEGRSYLDASGTNLSAAFGLYWEPMENGKLKLGASYTSQPGFGTMRLNGELRNQFGTDTQQTTTRVDLLQTYPDIFRIGAGYRVTTKVELRLDAEWVRWHFFGRQCIVNEGERCLLDANGGQGPEGKVVLNIPREWRDAFGLRAGGAYFVNDRLELFGSLALTTSAVPKSTIDASTIDSLRFYGSLGARYEVSKHIAVAGSYTHIYFVPVDTKGASKLDTYAQTSRSPSSDGKYSSNIGFLNFNATYSF